MEEKSGPLSKNSVSTTTRTKRNATEALLEVAQERAQKRRKKQEQKGKDTTESTQTDITQKPQKPLFRATRTWPSKRTVMTLPALREAEQKEEKQEKEAHSESEKDKQTANGQPRPFDAAFALAFDVLTGRVKPPAPTTYTDENGKEYKQPQEQDTKGRLDMQMLRYFKGTHKYTKQTLDTFPHNDIEFGWCEDLLDAFPPWRARLQEMQQFGSHWNAMAGYHTWKKLKELYHAIEHAKQLDLADSFVQDKANTQHEQAARLAFGQALDEILSKSKTEWQRDHPLASLG
jgi:hypothetical protein